MKREYIYLRILTLDYIFIKYNRQVNESVKFIKFNNL